MAVMQHNWTGSLALHASQAALTLAQPVKGVNANSKSSGRGVWLKAASHARLRLHAPSSANSHHQQQQTHSAVISLHIQDTVLLQSCLTDAHIKLALLPAPSQQTSVLVLLPAGDASSSAAAVTYCFAFFDQPDCDSFTSALQSMLDKQHQQQKRQPVASEHPQPGQEQGAEADQANRPGDALQMSTAAAAASHVLLQADAKEAVKVRCKQTLDVGVLCCCCGTGTSLRQASAADY